MEPLEQWGATDELIPRDLSSTLSTVEIEASVNLPFSLDNWILITEGLLCLALYFTRSLMLMRFY